MRCDAMRCDAMRGVRGRGDEYIYTYIGGGVGMLHVHVTHIAQKRHMQIRPCKLIKFTRTVGTVSILHCIRIKTLD